MTNKKRELVGRMKLEHGPRPPNKTDRKRPDVSRMRKESKQCGAKCRDGHACRSTILGKNGRCKKHGGTNRGNQKQTSEKARKASLKHGIYSEGGLLEDEYAVYDTIQNVIGTLNHELSMVRISLRRAYNAQQKIEKAKEELAAVADDRDAFLKVAVSHRIITLKQIEDQEGQEVLQDEKGESYLQQVVRSKITRIVHDYNADILRFTKAIRELEQARKELLETEDFGEDFVRQLAEDLRRFTLNADKTVPGEIIVMGTGSYKGLSPAFVTQ